MHPNSYGLYYIGFLYPYFHAWVHHVIITLNSKDSIFISIKSSKTQIIYMKNFYLKLLWFVIGAFFVITITKVYISCNNIHMLSMEPVDELSLFYSSKVLELKVKPLKVGYCDTRSKSCINCKN